MNGWKRTTLAALVGASLMLSAACEKPLEDETPAAERIRPAEVSVFGAPGPPPDAIASREKDSERLSEAEVFAAHQRIEVLRGLFMTRKAQRLDYYCEQAAWGEQLLILLERVGCGQITRAFYEQDDRKYLALTVLIQVEDAKGAEEVAGALGSSRLEGFVRRLPGSAPFDEFGRGRNKARVAYRGHYVSVVWAQPAPGIRADPIDLIALTTVPYLELVLKDRLKRPAGPATATP
jgi:hypothetical protein